MSLLAMFHSGAGGVAVPERPLAFDAGFRLPASPNTHLVAPPSAALPAHARHAGWRASGAELWAAIQHVAKAMPRTTLLATWPEAMQAQWVARSALMNYPDVVVAQLLPGEQRSALILYSRSLIGWSDLGANAARCAEWLAALDAALPRG
jgi:uncharacterized protein (DUF1499 family)